MLLAYNTRSISRPWQTSASVDISRTDFYGAFDFLFGGYFSDSPRWANTSTQSTGIFAVTLGHNETRRPESSHPGLSKGRVDGIGGTNLHTKTAALTELECSGTEYWAGRSRVSLATRRCMVEDPVYPYNPLRVPSARISVGACGLV